MKKFYSYQKISQLYRRFQFHISGFVLAVAGIWIVWEISRQPIFPDWLLYFLSVWALALVIELFRFYYVFKSRKKNKNR